MSAERGPARGGGTMTMSRPSFSGERGGSFSRSVISSPRSESKSVIHSPMKAEGPRLRTLPQFKPASPSLDRQARSFNFKDSKPFVIASPSTSLREKASMTTPSIRLSRHNDRRTMSRREFDAKYVPFSPNRPHPNPLLKGEGEKRIITHQFGTQRHEPTINRSALDRVKREIRTTIVEPKQNETRKAFPKMQLYTIREATPKVSLIMPVTLEKKQQQILETPRVSLIKPVSLEKRQKETTPKVSLIKPVSLEKRMGLKPSKQQSYEMSSRGGLNVSEGARLLDRGGERIRDPWIPAFAGMTKENKLWKNESFKKDTLQYKRPIERPVRYKEFYQRPIEYAWIRKNLDPKEEVIYTFNNGKKIEQYNPKAEKNISKTDEKEITTNNTSTLEQRIRELVPSYGLEKTHKILINEGKDISLEKVFRIAINQAWEPIIKKIKLEQKRDIQEKGKKDEIVQVKILETVLNKSKKRIAENRDPFLRIYDASRLLQPNRVILRKNTFVNGEPFDKVLQSVLDVSQPKLDTLDIKSPGRVITPLVTSPKLSIFQEIKSSVKVMIENQKKESRERQAQMKLREEQQPSKYIVDKKAQAVRQNMVNSILTRMYFFSDATKGYKLSGKEFAAKLPDLAPNPAMSRLAKLKNKTNDGSYVEWRQQLAKSGEELSYMDIMGQAYQLTKEIPPVDYRKGKGSEVTHEDVRRVLEVDEENPKN